MIYVDKQLDNDKWEEYSLVHEKAGLKPLVVTKMRQIYLGLSQEITWCKDMNETLCEELMEYILMNGNFGHKENIDEVRVVNALARINGIVVRMKVLQKNGIKNWKLLKKYPKAESVCLGARTVVLYRVYGKEFGRTETAMRKY